MNRVYTYMHVRSYNYQLADRMRSAARFVVIHHNEHKVVPTIRRCVRTIVRETYNEHRFTQIHDHTFIHMPLIIHTHIFAFNVSTEAPYKRSIEN